MYLGADRHSPESLAGLTVARSAVERLIGEHPLLGPSLTIMMDVR